MRRPLSITIIAWLLIVTAAISVIVNTVMLDHPTARELMAEDPVPMPVQYAILYLSLMINLTAGIAMLKGRSWGRFLYVVAGVIGFAIAFATSPAKALVIPGAVVFVVIVVFLFLPTANAYFSRRGLPSDAPSA